MSDTDQLVDLNEMAKLIGVHPETLRLYFRQKRVRGYKLGNNIPRFDPKEVRDDLRVHNYKKKHKML